MSDISDANKAATMSFFIDALNNGNQDIVAALLSPDYLMNGQPSSIADNQGWVASLQKDLPGHLFTIEAILAEDDLVALRWRLDVPAMGSNPARYALGTNILRFVGGKAITNDQTPATPIWATA